MHEVFSRLSSREALVEELVLVVDKVLVILEVVLLSAEELVELAQPGAVHGLALRLRTVVNVVVMTEILVSIGHVLRGVNVKVLALAVSDSKTITLGNLVVFAEISAQKGSVGLPIEVLEDLVVNETYTEKGEELPTGSHL